MSGAESPVPARRAPLAPALGALTTLVRAVPRGSALRAADRLGRAWARLSLPRMATARRNLRLAFPEWSEDERRRVLERAMGNLARSFVEFAWQSQESDETLRRLADLENVEHLDAARARSPVGGAICTTAHLGNWELLAAIMAAHGYPITIVVHGRDDPGLDARVAALRERPGIELLTLGQAARGSLRALRGGRFLAVPIDQNAPRNEGVFVPFFGRLACTRDGPARLALRTGAPILPVFIERLPDGERHRIRFEAPIFPEELQGEDRDRAARTIVARATALVEAAVRRAPDQWIWTHRRWRTQPPGEPRPYPPRRRAISQTGDAKSR